jgi:hypothetical protein
LNHIIKNVAETGIIVDPFHSGTSDALSNIDYGESDGGLTDNSRNLKIGGSVRDSREVAIPM